MWYIMSRSGLRGIEKYTSEAQAWQAADLRNSLANQGWHPIRVEVAQSTSFVRRRAHGRLSCARAVFAQYYTLQKIKM